MGTLRPILGTATTAGEATEATTDPTATMATTERGLLMTPPSLPLDPTLTTLAPTLMLRLTPGTDTTATRTGHMDMVIMATDPTAMPTGDKKWTSRTTSDLFLPTHL